MVKLVVCCFFIIGSSLSALAQGISVSQAIDQSDIAFEGEARFEITLTWSGSQAAYLFTQPLRPQFSRLKPQQYASSISSTGSGTDEVTTKKYSYTLKPTESGQGRIDPIVINYLMWPDSIPGQLITEAMTLTIANPIPITKSEESNLLVIIAIAAAVVAAGSSAAWFVVGGKRVKEQPIVKSPGAVFLDRLQILKRESGDDLKTFQTGLYKHLLQFLTERYGVHQDGDSVHSLVEQLAGADLSESHRDKISGWLMRADREKFTPVQAGPGETTRLEVEIRSFFEKNML